MYRSVRVLSFLILLICGQSALADPPRRDDAGWLETMAFAAHQTDYSGTFVYQDGMGGHVAVSRITHISDADGEHERLEGLNGARREIVSSNNRVWLFLGDRKVRIERRQGGRTFPALLPEQISILKENYLIKQAEEDRVAGFHVHAVVFQPKDNLRYTHKMWAHNESGLLLKAVVLDERARIIEQYAFTQLTLGGSVDRSWIEPEKSAQSVSKKSGIAPPVKSDTEFKMTDWQIDALPVGFKKIMEVCRPMRDKTKPVTHLVFSDGLAGISVFIEDVGGREDVNSGLSSQGAVQVYSRVSGDKLITVVGEVPPRTVIQVAESVRYAGP
ncbi:MAG: siderophore-interacting protein [Gallionellaceae bacterium]|nr:MAG: siderophore-interacting protein [Gallionellaceae bacterium]